MSWSTRSNLPARAVRRRFETLFHNGDGLYVTWATLSSHLLDPVAAYLYQQLRPLWGEVVPFAPQIAVNLPLSA